MEYLASTTTALTIPLLLPITLYIDAKLHLAKDLGFLLRRVATNRAIHRAAAADRLSPYYLIERNALNPKLALKEAIWARDTSGSVSRYTFQDVLDKANQFAHWFASRGTMKGDLVGLYMLNSADFLFVWIGLLAIGAAPAMLNYHLRGDALAHCLRISGARLVVVDGEEQAWERVGEVHRGQRVSVEFVKLKDVKRDATGMRTERLPDEMRSGIKVTHPMALFYTSGTTGRPKGCPLAVAAAFGNTTLSDSGSEPRYCGISAIGQLIAGNTVCVAPRFSASNFWRDVRDSGATWFVYVGETLRYLLAAPPSPLDKQHNVHSIFGNGLRPDVWHRFCERFGITQVFEIYNSSEGMLALYNASLNDYTAHAVGHHGFLQRWKFRRDYVPVAVDVETGDIVRNPKTGFAYRMPYEVGGEILVRLVSEKQFLGYWCDPKATGKKIVRDVFENGDCYYRTGDALRRDGEGRWFFVDRHDGKAGAAAIYLDPNVNDMFDHRDFLRYARTHLPKFAVPLFLRHVQAPFSTHNNKQNKLPLKHAGVDPDKMATGDKLFWIEGHGKGATYIPFTRRDWAKLQAGKAKL
ncbi:Isopenicillin N epimerase component 1 [Corynascus novoguineensis]|uniref:Isopenicillin N epimerase component 1 n=1 Tax=Corynascus novoguineensis TaxID=1126955 RepID=A0AAN7CV97_9PEZI|nr:Isopenicillin N epimerase component 1 [Corynascus novoguineensis]